MSVASRVFHGSWDIAALGGINEERVVFAATPIRLGHLVEGQGSPSLSCALVFRRMLPGAMRSVNRLHHLRGKHWVAGGHIQVMLVFGLPE